jgi:hypothetical protein
MLLNLEKNTELPITPAGKVAELVQSLDSSLTALKPDNSEITQIITYALLATAMVGIMVYQYIREEENNEN